MSISTRIAAIRADLPPSTQLVAVSKYHSEAEILEAYNANQRIFGESKAQELLSKYEALPKDIEWHFIGHLQSNKVKYIAPFVALIHGIDSYKLLEEVNNQAQKAGRIIPCLLQIHIAQEETKFGFSPQECQSMLQTADWRALSHISLVGLMGMASNTENKEQVRAEFQTIASLFQIIKKGPMADQEGFKELSIGMSADYLLAIEAGSTLIRVGSHIFQTTEPV